MPAVVVALLASFIHVAASDIPRLEQLQERVDAAAMAVFDGLGAEPATCPESYAEATNWKGRSALLCGHVALAADALRDRRDEIVRDLLDAGLAIDATTPGGTSWVTPEGRSFDVRALAFVFLPVQLVVDVDRGNVAISYPADYVGMDGRMAAVDPANRDREITLPESIEKVQPEYPEIARQARLTGRVVLQFVISQSGEVEDVEVVWVDKPHIGFETAAVAAVRQWRYEPARMGDTPVDVYTTMIVEFNLH